MQVALAMRARVCNARQRRLLTHQQCGTLYRALIRFGNALLFELYYTQFSFRNTLRIYAFTNTRDILYTRTQLFVHLF